MRFLLLALLIFSCGRSVPRFGRRTSSGGSDAGTKITPDAGPKRIADAGPVAECVLRNDAFRISPLLVGERAARSGAAQVTSISPLNFRFFDDEELFSFDYTDTRVFRDVAPGDEVFAEVAVEQPWWTNTKVMLFDISRGAERGRLIAGGWTFGDGGIGVDELGYYDDDTCAAVDLISCGKVLTQSFVWSRDGRTERIGVGEEASISDLTIGNGWSFRFDPGPTCTDTPQGIRSGFVMRSHDD